MQRYAKSRIPGAQGEIADEGLRQSLRQFIEARGEHDAVEILDIDRLTVARILALLPVRRASLESVSTRLAAAA